MMWWNHGFGWGWPVFLVMALVCVAMMAGMMRHGMMGHGMMGHGTSGDARPTSDRDENTPERILARRLASGEIDVQEYERLRDALQLTSKSIPDAAAPSHAGQRPPQA